MRQHNIWWFGAIEPAIVEDFQRRACCALPLQPIPDEASIERDRCFEHDIEIGDLVVLSAGEAGPVLVGDIDGEALSRPKMSFVQLVRSVRWRSQPVAENDDVAQWHDALAGADVPSPIAPEMHPELAARLDAVPLDDDATSFAFAIELHPPKIPPPALPILYQSPYAGRILRDFRWREYLASNPDVALTGEGEAHAFHHFFHQGYYERRIFDAKRLDGFDPGFYRTRYPELELPTDAAAQIHYCYHGWYEERIPNPSSEWLYDAALHVYQMGKVGSHSIATALDEAGYDGGVIHLHWATDIVTGYPSNRMQYSRILVHERARPVKVISATREIVSWALSGLFQYHGESTLNEVDAVALVEERFWQMCQNGLRWFEHRYYSGLDVYAHPFDHAAGCTRIDHPGIELFIYRQEDLPRMEAPLAAFLDLPELRLPHRNVGDGKGYSDLYLRIKREFRMPGNLLSRLYDTPFMRHFYSDAEREAGYARWARRN